MCVRMYVFICMHERIYTHVFLDVCRVSICIFLFLFASTSTELQHYFEGGRNHRLGALMLMNDLSLCSFDFRQLKCLCPSGLPVSWCAFCCPCALCHEHCSTWLAAENTIAMMCHDEFASAPMCICCVLSHRQSTAKDAVGQ